GGAHLRLLVSRRNAGGRDGGGSRQALTAIQGRCHYQMVGGRTFGWNFQATGEARTWRQEVRRRGRGRGGRGRDWACGGKAEGGEQYRRFARRVGPVDFQLVPRRHQGQVREVWHAGLEQGPRHLEAVGAALQQFESAVTGVGHEQVADAVAVD